MPCGTRAPAPGEACATQKAGAVLSKVTGTHQPRARARVAPLRREGQQRAQPLLLARAAARDELVAARLRGRRRRRAPAQRGVGAPSGHARVARAPGARTGCSSRHDCCPDTAAAKAASARARAALRCRRNPARAAAQTPPRRPRRRPGASRSSGLVSATRRLTGGPRTPPPQQALPGRPTARHPLQTHTRGCCAPAWDARSRNTAGNAGAGGDTAGGAHCKTGCPRLTRVER